jgi:hypothetical protein
VDGETETRCTASSVRYVGVLVCTRGVVDERRVCRARVCFCLAGATVLAAARAGALCWDAPEARSACGAAASRAGESRSAYTAAPATAKSVAAKAAPPVAQRSLGRHDRAGGCGTAARDGCAKPSAVAQ